MCLSLKNVTKTYGQNLALDHFTYDFAPGITGIIGANGSGKSTLLNLICDLIHRDSGSITYRGEEILKMGSRFRSVLGFMPQESGMYDEMTVYEFLVYCAEIKGISKKKAKEQIPYLLDLVNLSDRILKKTGSLSGGMRQRVSLAQSMLGDPEVLLLDEPTAGLDPEERIRLRNRISEYSKGRITLLTTHISTDIENAADRVLMMKKGKIVIAADTEHFITDCGAENLEQAYLLRNRA